VGYRRHPFSNPPAPCEHLRSSGRLAVGIGAATAVFSFVDGILFASASHELLNTPDPETLGGLRDRAILALLIGCGLRRAEILSLEVNQIQQREGRWVIPDLIGKGNRRRTVPVPSWVKVRIEEWVLAADIYKGKLFRPVTKGRCLRLLRMYGPPRDCKGKVWSRRQVCANVFGLWVESSSPGQDELRACLSFKNSSVVEDHS